MATSPGRLEPPEAGGAARHCPSESSSLATPRFQTSGLQNWERIQSCCFKPLSVRSSVAMASGEYDRGTARTGSQTISFLGRDVRVSDTQLMLSDVSVSVRGPTGVASAAHSLGRLLPLMRSLLLGGTLGLLHEEVSLSHHPLHLRSQPSALEETPCAELRHGGIAARRPVSVSSRPTLRLGLGVSSGALVSRGRGKVLELARPDCSSWQVSGCSLVFGSGLSGCAGEH